MAPYTAKAKPRPHATIPNAMRFRALLGFAPDVEVVVDCGVEPEVLPVPAEDVTGWVTGPVVGEVVVAAAVVAGGAVGAFVAVEAHGCVVEAF